MESTTVTAKCSSAIVLDCSSAVDKAMNLLEIVSAILKHLPMKDLQRMALVCKNWNVAVKQVKKSRCQLSWLLYNGSLPSNVTEQLNHVTQLLASEPVMALLFASSILYDKPLAAPSPKNSASSTQHTVSIVGFVQNILPPACKLFTVAADGIIGTSVTNELYEMESLPSASCFLMPKLLDIEVFTFKYDLQNYSDEAESYEAIQNFVRFDPATLIPGHTEDVKLILWFLGNTYNSEEKKLGLDMLKHYHCAVIAGGFVDRFAVRTFENTTFESSGCGVAFCGKDVKVASVVLDSKVKTESQICKRLQLLKNSNMSEKKSVGFMFACVGRGKHFHRGKRNFESTQFKKLFPSTPLFGFFGNGEIGFDYTPNYAQNSNSASLSDIITKMLMHDLFHSYSTVFVLVSFDKGVKM